MTSKLCAKFFRYICNILTKCHIIAYILQKITWTNIAHFFQGLSPHQILWQWHWCCSYPRILDGKHTKMQCPLVASFIKFYHLVEKLLVGWEQTKSCLYGKSVFYCKKNPMNWICIFCILAGFWTSRMWPRKCGTKIIVHWCMWYFICCYYPSLHNKLSRNVLVFSSHMMTCFWFKNPSSGLA